MHDMNHTSVTPEPVRAYADETIALLNHVEAVEDEIGELIGDTERSVNAQLADRHREISASLKWADIYSNLAIAEAIDKLCGAVHHHRLATLSASNFADGDPHR
jgi:hypothetical protein